jgi:hypothetical protein
VLLVLAAGGAANVYYNWRVTGSPWLTPYQLHEKQYSVAPNWLFLKPRPMIDFPSSGVA